MLYEKLNTHFVDGPYPMHMPGHKRNPHFLPDRFPYDIDITEIYGFDDLRDPRGILLDTARLAADLYGSREAFLLVNGSTVGVLAAIGAHVKYGEKILAASNCHWSTPNAATLFGLKVVYVTPETDEISGVPCSITPDSIYLALKKNPGIKLVIITSPTYEGVISDVAAIAEVTHKSGALLAVDSAHGAHLGFSDDFPKSAVADGADLVVVSLHKTLPALTQCSLLHICSERADTTAVRRLLNILQTSSPSYVLMASIDHCLRLLQADSYKLFREYEQRLSNFSYSLLDMQKLIVLNHGHDKHHPGFYDFDPGKIVILTKNIPLSSKDLYDILRIEYKIEAERVFENYVIALTSICDCAEGFARLSNALCVIDSRQ